MELHPITIAIRSALEVAANPENAPHMQAYMKSEMLFRGVKTPEQRQIYRQLLKQ